MRLEAQKYLFDVLEALNLVAEYCADETYERYAVSSMLRAAVERQFITAGEALTQLARIDSRVPLQIQFCAKQWRANVNLRG